MLLLMSEGFFAEANMGAFLGEASKVPFILRRFQPHWYDRTERKGKPTDCMSR